jgi:hypothetical protein
VTGNLAERERIARLADQCNARYEVGFQDVSFAHLIRTGRSTPPWWNTEMPDPLSADGGDRTT